MLLYQKQGQVQYYIGWYGLCDETGAPDASNPDTPCQTLDLLASTYADGTLVEWSNGKGNFREQLVSVAQTSTDRATIQFFSMKNWFETYNFYRNVLFYDNLTARTATDADARGDNQPPGDEFPNNINDFKDMICGKAYTIIVKAGDTPGAAVGDVVSRVEIPEFTYRTVSSEDSGLRLTPDCNPYG